MKTKKNNHTGQREKVSEDTEISCVKPEEGLERKIRKKNKKKRKYRRNRISMSALFTTSVVSIVLMVTVISMIFFIFMYRETMEENALTNSEQTVEQVQKRVEEYVDDISLIMTRIQESMAQSRESLDEYMEKLTEIRNDVVALTAYDENGNMTDYWCNGPKLKEYYAKNLSYVENIYASRDTRTGFSISSPHVVSIFEGYYPWVVTVSQRIPDAQGNMVQVALDIRFNQIEKYVEGIGIGQRGYCYITDDEGEIIYHPQQQLVYSGLKEENRESEKEGTYMQEDALYTVQSLSNCDWKIVGVSYVKEVINNQTEWVVSMMFGLFVIVLVIALLSGQILSGILTGAVSQLAEAMKNFEDDTGNYDLQPLVVTKEIQSLSVSFEHMVKKIQKLMVQVREEEISLKKTELKALQAQINPHFLYNTLDAIMWLCEEGRNEDAAMMVNALARLFRISISKGNELIPIRKEMQHAQSYLEIQKFRYKDQFVYHFDVDEECLDYYCNKITLQPLIENAIYHGINRMVDEGRIDIGIHQSDSEIIFTVRDNGVGMTQEQCDELLRKERGEKKGAVASGGIGVKNVNDRIQIYFGNEYGISLESELDIGTCVTIRMPKVTENDYDKDK